MSLRWRGKKKDRLLGKKKKTADLCWTAFGEKKPPELWDAHPTKLWSSLSGLGGGPPLEEGNTYNFSMRKPTIDDGCGANAFAAWENKLYVVVCGGIPGVEIRTVKKIVLSIGIELDTDDFFDEHYLVRNLASLFGIPADRMRVPQIVAGTERRRRRLDGSSASVVPVAAAAELCAPTCDAHGVWPSGSPSSSAAQAARRSCLRASRPRTSGSARWSPSSSCRAFSAWACCPSCCSEAVEPSCTSRRAAARARAAC